MRGAATKRDMCDGHTTNTAKRTTRPNPYLANQSTCLRTTTGLVRTQAAPKNNAAGNKLQCPHAAPRKATSLSVHQECGEVGTTRLPEGSQTTRSSRALDVRGWLRRSAVCGSGHHARRTGPCAHFPAGSSGRGFLARCAGHDGCARGSLSSWRSRNARRRPRSNGRHTCVLPDCRPNAGAGGRALRGRGRNQTCIPWCL